MLSECLNSSLYSAKRSAIREFSRLAKETPGCLSLTLGEPDFDTPERVCSAVGEAFAHHETHYIENNGTLALRESIACFERERNGMDYTADEVIVTAGATEALFVALYGVLNPGDEVIVPTPAFVLYEQIINLCRGVYVPMDTSDDAFQISAEKLSSLITPRTKAIVINSPNNPTGCIYTHESLDAIYRAVKGKDIFVICDDVYRQLIYTASYTSFATYRDLREQLLVVQSFSKPYAMTGWRVGYLLSDRSIKQHLELLHQFLVVSAPAPFQRACAAALEHDTSDFVACYKKRRDYVCHRLKEMGLELMEPEGAFYAFPSIAKFGLTSAEFCRRMIREAGLAVTPGFCFGSDRHIRISYCCADEVLQDGMDRLERFIHSL